MKRERKPFVGVGYVHTYLGSSPTVYLGEFKRFPEDRRVEVREVAPPCRHPAQACLGTTPWCPDCGSIRDAGRWYKPRRMA